MKMRNPKLLALLRKGCSITFPSTVIFQGLPNTGYIETAMRGTEDMNEYVSIDLYDLSEEGLEEAIDYEELYTATLEDNEELESEERRKEMQ